MDDVATILIVEDDPTIRALVEMALRSEGFVHVRSAARGDDGLDEIRRSRPDLVLLDIMLPGLDGYTVCRRVRETPALADVRILMLTARTQSDDVVRGLDAGADDYVAKPFDRAVLMARVRALLRRGAGKLPETEAADGLVLNEESRTARLGGEELRLTPTEFRILALLASHPGRVLTRSRILDAVQNEEKSVTERTVDVQMVGLRKKLGAWGARVETVRGVGYRVAPSG